MGPVADGVIICKGQSLDLISVLTQQSPQLDLITASRFASLWTLRQVEPGCDLIRQGDASQTEMILLTGSAASVISDAEGREACLGLYAAPCVITPHVARTREGVSYVSIEVTDKALVATLPAHELQKRMVTDETLRDWGNAVLRAELECKSDREWALSALGGAARLTWFQNRFPGYDHRFAQIRIASFLGMTPVTLSRLRSALR